MNSNSSCFLPIRQRDILDVRTWKVTEIPVPPVFSPRPESLAVWAGTFALLEFHLFRIYS
jgi:hypothetical protein